MSIIVTLVIAYIVAYIVLHILTHEQYLPEDRDHYDARIHNEKVKALKKELRRWPRYSEGYKTTQQKLNELED